MRIPGTVYLILFQSLPATPDMATALTAFMGHVVITRSSVQIPTTLPAFMGQALTPGLYARSLGIYARYLGTPFLL